MTVIQPDFCSRFQSNHGDAEGVKSWTLHDCFLHHPDVSCRHLLLYLECDDYTAAAFPVHGDAWSKVYHNHSKP